jgi:hypothetical protein
VSLPSALVCSLDFLAFFFFLACKVSEASAVAARVVAAVAAIMPNSDLHPGAIMAPFYDTKFPYRMQ